MSTIFDKIATRIRRNVLTVFATLLLVSTPIPSTAFAQPALTDPVDSASTSYEQPIDPVDNLMEPGNASSAFDIPKDASSDLDNPEDDGSDFNNPEDDGSDFEQPVDVDADLTNPADAASDSLKAEDELSALSAQDEYQSGTIPILRLTFHDDVDPQTGEVVLSGNEKIELMQGSANHSYRASGVTLDLEVPSTYDNPESDLWDDASGYTGETNLALEFIRGRGNSTWRAVKKPYKFKLDKGANLFGMGKNKHWVLLANYYDTSLTVNRLVAWLGEQMGLSYTPRSVPVDLYLNDEYYGNYLLIEEVRVDSSRVDIDAFDAARKHNVMARCCVGGQTRCLGWHTSSGRLGKPYRSACSSRGRSLTTMRPTSRTIHMKRDLVPRSASTSCAHTRLTGADRRRLSTIWKHAARC